ncbi:hypothetical protein L596_012856 [Steinernema carpocapsae]|uniref:Protein kinase domain-containing protein n=1 Tax=Steinernema carpocapsae TaxID=34508 RepID=A0A4U5NYH0_STECR|nr:hypothetical protein L596_012856 [Steinernema carpocapsae]
MVNENNLKSVPAVDHSGKNKNSGNQTESSHIKSASLKRKQGTLDHNEKQDARCDLTPFYTAKELLKPFCQKGNVAQVAEGVVSADEALVGDFGIVRCQLSSLPEHHKLQLKYEKRSLRFRLLKTEVAVLIRAKVTQNGRFFPHVYTRGLLSGTHIFYVTDFPGNNLAVQRVVCGGRFDTTTTFRLAASTLNCIRTLHKMGYVHRDIRPNVFTVSVFPNSNRILLSFLGMCREMPIEKREWKRRHQMPFLGTVQFCSRGNHLQLDHVFADDLESWFYMACEWIHPAALPWAKEADKDDALRAKEDFMTAEKGFKEALKRCPDLPPEFVDVLHYVNSVSGEFVVPRLDLSTTSSRRSRRG